MNFRVKGSKKVEKVILFFISPNLNQQKLSHHPGGDISEKYTPLLNFEPQQNLHRIFQVCKSAPAPKPLDEINVHFHLDYESSESADGKGKFFKERADKQIL